MAWSRGYKVKLLGGVTADELARLWSDKDVLGVKTAPENHVFTWKSFWLG